ncbi:MAG TPA: hypothetical protein VN081_06550 [Dongiaceae bacterium]|nr:hypothetical protein [Dongiaceae bacterium]
MNPLEEWKTLVAKLAQCDPAQRKKRRSLREQLDQVYNRLSEAEREEVDGYIGKMIETPGSISIRKNS